MGSTINICEDIYNITKDKIWVSEMSADYVKKKYFKETAEREYCFDFTFNIVMYPFHLHKPRVGWQVMVHVNNIANHYNTDNKCI